MTTSPTYDRPAGRRQFLATAGLVLAFHSSHGHADTHERGQRITWPAVNLVGGGTLMPEDWRNTAAIVVFWATWCPYCRRHNARIERLSQKFASNHLRFLGVAVDGDETTIRSYMTENGFHFPVVRGNASLRSLFTSRRVIPMTCLVDRGGNLVQSIPGEMAEDDVMELAIQTKLFDDQVDVER